MNEIEVAETLKTLSAKMDELSKAFIEKKGLSAKMDELSGALSEAKGNISSALNDKKAKAEEKIRTSPFAYIGGAFVGGMALGYLMSRTRKG